MSRKTRGQIAYELGGETLTVNYTITPGKPGEAYNQEGGIGTPPDPPGIEIEIFNSMDSIIDVDQDIANIIINLCFEDSEGNQYDKYSDD